MLLEDLQQPTDDATNRNHGLPIDSFAGWLMANWLEDGELGVIASYVSYDAARRCLTQHSYPALRRHLLTHHPDVATPARLAALDTYHAKFLSDIAQVAAHRGKRAMKQAAHDARIPPELRDERDAIAEEIRSIRRAVRRDTRRYGAPTSATYNRMAALDAREVANKRAIHNALARSRRRLAKGLPPFDGYAGAGDMGDRARIKLIVILGR